jgi:hypothetical protein
MALAVLGHPNLVSFAVDPQSGLYLPPVSLIYVDRTDGLGGSVELHETKERKLIIYDYRDACAMEL